MVFLFILAVSCGFGLVVALLSPDRVIGFWIGFAFAFVCSLFGLI